MSENQGRVDPALFKRFKEAAEIPKTKPFTMKREVHMKAGFQRMSGGSKNSSSRPKRLPSEPSRLGRDPPTSD